MARIRKIPEDNEWPHWFYGPNGEATIFNSASEVPYGWTKKPGEVFEPPPGPQLYDRDELEKRAAELEIIVNPIWGNAHLKKMIDDRSPPR